MLNGVEHANFFETRATEYAKAATGGAWHGDEGAWGLFDRRVARRGQLELLGERSEGSARASCLELVRGLPKFRDLLFTPMVIALKVHEQKDAR